MFALIKSFDNMYLRLIGVEWYLDNRPTGYRNSNLTKKTQEYSKLTNQQQKKASLPPPPPTTTTTELTWFDPYVRQKLFTISQIDVVEKPQKQLGAEAYYYVTINTPNDMQSEVKQTPKSRMVGRKKQSNKQTTTSFKFVLTTTTATAVLVLV